MWIAIGILVVVLVVLAVAVATRPDTFRVVRSATIAAPADLLFGYVNDFHQWNLWSPWEKLDPNMMRTFSGAASGVTATYTWSGNSKAGEGSMQITESAPAQRVVLDLNFIRPFKSENVIEFTFAPTPGATQVTWAMSGTNNVVTKLMSLVTSMDKLVGKDFDQGLANLKALAETEAKRRAG